MSRAAGSMQAGDNTDNRKQAPCRLSVISPKPGCCAHAQFIQCCFPPELSRALNPLLLPVQAAAAAVAVVAPAAVVCPCQHPCQPHSQSLRLHRTLLSLCIGSWTVAIDKAAIIQLPHPCQHSCQHLSHLAWLRRSLLSLRFAILAIPSHLSSVTQSVGIRLCCECCLSAA